MTRSMMPWAEQEHAEFVAQHGYHGNCSCHISPPCGSCVHPGNPENLDVTPEAWGEEHEVMAAYALIDLQEFINTTAARHLAEMAQTWKGAPT